MNNQQNTEAAPVQAVGNSTRYMEGVFTPLDSEEVQTACRSLWDELDKVNSDLLQQRDALAEALTRLVDYLDLTHLAHEDTQMAAYLAKARAALALVEGGAK